MQGVPDGVVSGPKCVYPWGFCKLQGLCFTRTAKQGPGRAGEKRPGCSPSCPFGRPLLFSRLLAPSRALAWPARDDLPKRVHGWTWDCHGQVGWYGEAGLWLERLRSRLHCRRPPSPHALFQKQLQAVWPSLTFELASAVAWKSCFAAASAKESSHLCSGEQLREPNVTKVGSDGCSSRIARSRNRTLLRLAAMDAPPVYRMR